MERDKAIAIAVLSGGTFEEVGHSYGLTRERARQITRREVKRVDPNNPHVLNKKRYRPLKHAIESAHTLRQDAERLIGLIRSR